MKTVILTGVLRELLARLLTGLYWFRSVDWKFLLLRVLTKYGLECWLEYILKYRLECWLEYWPYYYRNYGLKWLEYWLQSVDESVDRKVLPRVLTSPDFFLFFPTCTFLFFFRFTCITPQTLGGSGGQSPPLREQKLKFDPLNDQFGAWKGSENSITF